MYYPLAKAAITLAAAGLFAWMRPDVTLFLYEKYLIHGLGGYRRHVATPRLIDNYIQQHPVRKLQLGSGPNMKQGWLNTDIDMSTEVAANQAYLDGTERFPLPDGSFHYIYSEHVFEHVPYAAGQSMLRESFRVLAPGGKIRLATPNLLRYLALFGDKRTPEMDRYIQDKIRWHKWPVTPDAQCVILNLVLREWGHQFVYTPNLLQAELERAGFRQVREVASGQSTDPALQGLESREKWEFADANRYETMVFEAVKP